MAAVVLALVALACLGCLAFVLWFQSRTWRNLVPALRQVVARELGIRVSGGYSPDLLVVRKGIPVRLELQMDEATPCTDRFIVRELGIDEALPAFTTKQVDFTPARAGVFPITCGKNVTHGTLVVVAG